MSNAYKFKFAVPTFAEGREEELNLWIGYRTIIPKKKNVLLALTASTTYTAYINGTFVSYGPAKSAHGFYRVDEIKLDDYLTKEINVLTIVVQGYNAESFEYLKQSSFLCAEVFENDTMIAATGVEGFECFEVDTHEKEVQRFSYQRTFCEVYDYDSHYLDVFAKGMPIENRIKEAKVNAGEFIERGLPLNIFPYVGASGIIKRGSYRFGDYAVDMRLGRQIREKAPDYSGYPYGSEKTDSSLIARNIEPVTQNDVSESPFDAIVKDKEYVVYSMKNNTTGEFVLDVEAKDDTDLYIEFDEILNDKLVINFRRTTCTSIVIWHLKKGIYHLETAEPYTFKYAAVFASGADIEISDFGIRYFGDEAEERELMSEDEDLKKVYDAAVETFKQNTLTIFMDCPSRERAGWLCDSFFTSRAAYSLKGNADIERNFLENFILPEKFPGNIPEGILPMCYPSDTRSFIINWDMFFIIELKEYFQRSGDRELVDKAKDKVYDFLHYLKPYENNSGLLEKLKGWVFVEWSKCNELTQDVNYPTNMMYAYSLETVGELYDDEKLIQKANKIKETINREALIGDFYCDNAIRNKNGKLELSGMTTETCQYYAFFTGVADRKNKPKLFELLLNDFGPSRISEGNWPNLNKDAKWQDVYPSNAFIGNFLRLEMLYQNGYYNQLISEIKGYFLPMAEKTGTLWENMNTTASCNHGFTSHIVYWLDGMRLLRKKE